MPAGLAWSRLVVEKNSIGSEAWAGAASAAAVRRLASRPSAARGRDRGYSSVASCPFGGGFVAQPCRWAYCVVVALGLVAFAARTWPCLLDEAWLAASWFSAALPPLPVTVSIVGRSGRRGARAVALIGCLAGRWRFGVGEATAFAGVIDLDQLAVFVLGHERVAGEEVGVGAVGADAEQARGEGAGAGGDQAEAAGGSLEARAFVLQFPVPWPPTHRHLAFRRGRAARARRWS